MELPLAPDDAWDVVMDWERQSRWMLFTRVWATENGGIGVGGGVAARTSVGGVGFTDDMVITHWDPPRECTVKHLGKIVRGTGTFALTPAAPSSTAQAGCDSTAQAGSDSTAQAGCDSTAQAGCDSTAQAGSDSIGSAGSSSAGSVGSSSIGPTARSSADPAGASSIGSASAGGTRPAAFSGSERGVSGVGSTFTWSEDVVPPFGWLGVMVWPVVRVGFEAMMRVSLRRLVREVGA